VLTCVAIAAMGGFCFGYHLGVVNGPLNAIATSLGFAGDVGKAGLVVSSVLIGATLGSVGGGTIADAFGRRGALIANCLPLAAGALLCANAASFQGMVLGRALAGVGIGISSAVVPLYISEIGPPALRGSLGSVNQLSICIGILAALVANVVLPAAQWRDMFLVSLAPALLLLAGMAAYAPETPAHLKRSGQIEAARASAAKLGSSLADLAGSDEGAEGGAKQGAVASLLTKHRRPLQLGVTLFLLQQFAGINAIVYYSSAVFTQAGVANATVASAAVGLVNILGTVVAGSLVDRAGRKQLLSGSMAGMGTFMLLLAASMSVPALQSMAGTLSLVGTLGYILAFALGCGPIPALLSSEVFPVQVRGAGMSACLLTHWVANFCIGQFFLSCVEQ